MAECEWRCVRTLHRYRYGVLHREGRALLFKRWCHLFSFLHMFPMFALFSYLCCRLNGCIYVCVCVCVGMFGFGFFPHRIHLKPKFSTWNRICRFSWNSPSFSHEHPNQQSNKPKRFEALMTNEKEDARTNEIKLNFKPKKKHEEENGFTEEQKKGNTSTTKIETIRFIVTRNHAPATAKCIHSCESNIFHASFSIVPFGMQQQSQSNGQRWCFCVCVCVHSACFWDDLMLSKKCW